MKKLIVRMITAAALSLCFLGVVSTPAIAGKYCGSNWEKDDNASNCTYSTPTGYVSGCPADAKCCKKTGGKGGGTRSCFLKENRCLPGRSSSC